ATRGVVGTSVTLTRFPDRPRVRGDRRHSPACRQTTTAPATSGVAGAVVRVELVAGELLAERGERLVRGERALGRGVDDRRGGPRGGGPGSGVRVATLGRSRVSLGGLGDLLAVRLPARVCLGVLRLPDLTLRLEALEPLVRLGVEALGVGVVALLVVLGSHAVERGVELLGAQVHNLVGLLVRQRVWGTLEVAVDDLDEDLVAH